MQVPILSGIYADGVAQLRSSMPRNLVPVPKQSGISSGYLGPAPGLSLFGTGPGVDRGGINWNGVMYRVMASKLVRVDSSGAVTILGDVGGSGTVSLDYSFDRLSIASGNNLFYWNGSALSQVTDVDLGIVLDQIFIGGYFMTTDGSFLIVTELNDPMQVNPLKYGSSEADPDPVVALKRLRIEVMALNRYTIEVFQNIGGANFPFQRVDGAQIQKGCIGTHACCNFVETVAFVGSGRNESPSVYLAVAGSAQKIATREIDTILQNYTEAQLAACVVEAKVDKAHQHLFIHLPDQTLVFDAAGTAALGEPIWFTFTSSVVGLAQYRARNLVWAYGEWLAGDPQSGSIAKLIDTDSKHYGQTIGWEFGTSILYTEGTGGIVHRMELVSLPGCGTFGDDPVIWTSYSNDGTTWSQEHPVKAGKIGETTKRICWFRKDFLRNWRIQKFRGTSEAHISMLRLELQVEKLSG